MTTAPKIEGTIEPGYEAVREAFARNFVEHGEIGAAVCVYRDGIPVLDLWGGLADPESGRPWQRDTIQLVYSATKGVTAICLHRLAQQGRIDLDAPVSRYWPEFAANGKAEISVRQVLSHRAGLAAVEGELSLEQVLAWDPVVEAIAAQPTNWEPGTAHGYHARSYGWILGELVRRITGESLGAWLAREIAAPLGLDFHIGLPASEVARRGRSIPPDPGPSLAEILGSDSLTAHVMSGPSDLFSYNDMWNRPDVLGAEMPSSNGVGDARSLARLYAATLGELDGFRVLEPETVEEATRVQSEGRDKVIILATCFGSGFALAPMLAPRCGERSYGHPGAGGSLGFADPDAGIAFGYVMNKMKLGLRADERAKGLVEALYDSL